MDAYVDKSSIRNVRVRQGETIRLVSDGHTFQEISCDEIARLALAMYDHRQFFSVRRGLSISFSSDLNGSGTQGLYVTRKSDRNDPTHLIEIIFDYAYKKGGNFLYEADLIMDQGKDYEPSVNKGKHQFVAQSANMQIDWSSDETLQWRSDSNRLSKLPDTLAGWIEADLEMQVRCGTGHFCAGSAILTRSDIKRHAAAGLSLEDLKKRLKCSKCGKRSANISVF